MTVQDLIKELEKQNCDSDIVAFSIVVKDSLSGELTSLFPDGSDGVCYNDID